MKLLNSWRFGCLAFMFEGEQKGYLKKYFEVKPN